MVRILDVMKEGRSRFKENRVLLLSMQQFLCQNVSNSYHHVILYVIYFSC